MEVAQSRSQRILLTYQTGSYAPVDSVAVYSVTVF